MRSSIYSWLTAVIVLSTILAGCKDNKQTATGKTNQIKFDSIQVEKVYHLMGKQENPNCSLQLRFTYPSQYNGNVSLEKLQREFINAFLGEHYADLTPQEAVNKYTEDYLESYESLEDDFKDELSGESGEQVGAWFSYYEISGNEINYNKNDLVSFTTMMESYTGGAHGAHAVNNHVIYLPTGELLTEDDIFIDNYQDQLADILINHITKQKDLNDPKELENTGYFSIEEIYPNGNFRVDDDGITYDFNEYEIAAYVVGITQVKLPYKEIKHLLKTDSPVYPLAD